MFVIVGYYRLVCIVVISLVVTQFGMRYIVVFFFLMLRRPPIYTHFPYPKLFRSLTRLDRTTRVSNMSSVAVLKRIKVGRAHV